MNRDIFDDFPDGPFCGEREHYQPSSLCENLLIDELLSLYLDGTLKELYPAYDAGKGMGYNGERCADHIEELLSGRFDSDANTFLNDVAWHVHSRVELGMQDLAVNVLLTPLMQALHRFGHNDFTQDYSCFSGIEYLTPALNLRGSPQKLLNAAYRGDFGDFGTQARHCRLELYGTSDWAASNAYASEFHLYSPVNTLAVSSKQCTYHLYFKELNKLHLFSQFNYPGEHNTFYIHHYPDEMQRNRLRAKTWYGEGNKVCFLKEDGSWEGVCLRG